MMKQSVEVEAKVKVLAVQHSDVSHLEKVFIAAFLLSAISYQLSAISYQLAISKNSKNTLKKYMVLLHR